MSEDVGASTGSFPVLHLREDALSFIVEKKATCPFVGTAVATGCLPVRNDVSRPLAAIEEVRRLGNTGKGDLGEILVLFASGNHAKMPDKFDQDVPDGLFSLDFPGSQGSHPGHSGILQADPRQLNSGRFSQPDFDRLAGLAKDGFIKRSDVARFIARNLHEDKNSKVLGLDVAKLLADDSVQIVRGIGNTLEEKLTGSADAAQRAQRELEEKLTKLTGEDNLIGSCGEFGLLFAFLANRSGTKKVEGEPALRLDDLRLMFVEKRFPEGWESWKKTRLDWVRNTLALAEEASKEYLRL